MFTSNNTTINTASATYFTFDHIRKTIVGSEINFKRAGIPGSVQYKALMDVMALRPDYTLAPTPAKKKVEKKQTYAGLTFDLMKSYVEIKGNEVQRAEMAEYIDKEMAYATVKSWFLNNFRVGFTVEKAKAEIARHNLAERKAIIRQTVAVKVKAAKAAKTENATNTVLELPVPTAVNE